MLMGSVEDGDTTPTVFDELVGIGLTADSGSSGSA